MFKLGHKLITTATAIGVASLLLTGCNSNPEVVSKPSIDGGVYYPINGDKTSVYKVNPKAYGLKLNYGRTPTANEYKAWNKDIMPDGTGLPEGSGSVEDGEELYEAKCIMCHGDFGSGGAGYPALSKGNAQELQKTLTNNRWKDPEADGPIRVFGSYWPQASTLFWYIRDAMPHTKSKTLTADETYALVAYILNINEMSIDGQEVDDEYVLNREKFLKIKMPNRDGFVPNIDGKNGLENVRKFYANPSNYGAIKVEKSKRCMTNCQKDTVKIARVIGAGISDFHPAMSAKRDLPKGSNTDATHKVIFDAKKAYEETCTMCHGSFAPAAKDKDAWIPYLKKGMDKVYKNGIDGTALGMPAKGGSSLSDEEFKKVVDYMVNFK
jgi:cytochrome c